MSLMQLKLSKCKLKEKSLSKEYKNLRFQIKAKLVNGNFEKLISNVNKTISTRKHSKKIITIFLLSVYWVQIWKYQFKAIVLL